MALFKQWRSVWHSYPIVDYSAREVRSGGASISAALQDFERCTMDRFSRDKRLGMEALKLFVVVKDATANSLVQQLMKLAVDRKAAEFDVELSVSAKEPEFISLPFRLISDCSSAKTIRLKSVVLNCGNDLHDFSLNSLRFLDLYDVAFSDDRIWANLLASSPLLETLSLRSIPQLRKLKIHGNAGSNLKRIIIRNCHYLEEIGIRAPLLQDLSLRDIPDLIRIELEAPQLEILAIRGCNNLTLRDIETLSSNLLSLKSLTIGKSRQGLTELNLISAPNLERFTLWVQYTARTIELDVGSCNLEQFILRSCGNFPRKLRKCKIRNAPRCKSSST